VNALDLARWQFGITTVYHFIFVPLSIGLAALVAVMQTIWYRRKDPRYLRMTKFFGKLLLINFAVGVVTGIVQEFQFGMNWSDYSRFVGDVFGAPLAMEGLLAFFLESTFLGLWIFGWDKLKPAVHLATIWLFAIGTALSAYFIIAANSWMQHPVGYRINPDTKRAELTSIWEVLTNPTTLAAYPHVIFASLITAGMLIAGVAAWYLYKHRDTDVFRPALRLGLIVSLVASIGVFISGDIQARVMTEQQPMKMAAAEALYETSAPASFSLFTIGSLDGREELWSLRIPHLLSFMATGDPNGQVEGINDVQRAYEALYGPGSYIPVVPITYWNFRLMIGFGALAAAIALWGLWLTRDGRTPRSRWFTRAALIGIALPYLANTTGWIFTEMGRQPWVVHGMLRTADGVSPTVGGAEVIVSLAVFTVLYGVLAVVAGVLMTRFAKQGPPKEEELPKEDEPMPSFTY